MTTNKSIKLWDGLELTISEKDWMFLCENRFFSDTPTTEDVITEFITGTGITKNKPHLWNKASEEFKEYIKDLRKIQDLDINNMARDLLDDEEKFKEHI